MSRKFLVPIDLSKQELQNAVIQNLATPPGSPVAGQVYFDTVADTLYFYDGTVWVDAQTAPYSYGSGQSSSLSITGTATDGVATSLARADHTHAGPGFASVTAQTSFGASSADGSAATVARSDHSHGTPAHDGTAHSAISISSLALPTANFDFNNHKITNLKDPVDAGDAANKGYVDGAIAGLDWKTAVHLLRDSNIALTGLVGSGIVIDSHDPLTSADNGYRILLTNQTTDTEDGIYVFTADATNYTLTRAEDANSYLELLNASVFVSEGTLYGKTSWVQANHYLTSFASQEWVQFSGQGTYLASNGVVLDVNTFKFAPKTDGGLNTGATGAFVKLPTNSGLGTDSNGLAVGAGTGISVVTGTVSIDTAVVARKHSVSLTGSSTSYTVTHNLGTRDVTVQVREVASPYAKVEPDIEMTTTNTVTVKFAVAPTSDQYSVVVIG